MSVERKCDRCGAPAVFADGKGTLSGYAQSDGLFKLVGRNSLHVLVGVSITLAPEAGDHHDKAPDLCRECLGFLVGAVSPWGIIPGR